MKNTEKQPKTCLAEQIISKELELHAGGRSSLNLALFLASKDEICAAINAGLNCKVIWITLRDSKKFIGGYECFRRYVKRYIVHSNKQSKEPDCPKITVQPVTQRNSPSSEFSYPTDMDKSSLF